MRCEVKTISYPVWTSEVEPEIDTQDEDYAQVIAWADANPVAYRIVMATKSGAFGRNSSFYLGCSRGETKSAVLDRLADFKKEIERGPEDFHGWKAHFTLAHYDEAGFSSGLFRQHDGQYSRGCSQIDYTPSSLPEAVDRFVRWCGASYETRTVRVGERVVREYPARTATAEEILRIQEAQRAQDTEALRAVKSRPARPASTARKVRVEIEDLDAIEETVVPTLPFKREAAP